MARSIDTLRTLAIASQATGFVLIITLETLLGDAARPWQGLTLGVMVACALVIAVVRRYRRNRARKVAVERAHQHGDVKD